MVKKIPLQNGMFALVDDEDYERCMEHKWTLDAHKSVHQVRNQKGQGLGRFILGAASDAFISFGDNNGLNNKKDNLVVLNRQDLTRKRRGNRNSSSKYKGVSFNKKSKRWRASIGLRGKVEYLGEYSNEEEAASVYNEASKRIFGTLGFQNEIGKDNSAATLDSISIPLRRKDAGKFGRGVKADGSKWSARIWFNGRDIYIGYFNTAYEAALAHDKKAKELFGDKAILNFPDEHLTENLEGEK